MKRVNIKGIVLGVIAAIGFETVADLVLMSIFGVHIFKSGLTYQQLEETVALLTRRNGFLVADLIIGTLATVLGGYIAARVAKVEIYLNSGTIGLIGMALGFFSAGVYPVWFNIAGFLTVVPAALLGGHLAKSESLTTDTSLFTYMCPECHSFQKSDVPGCQKCGAMNPNHAIPENQQNGRPEEISGSVELTPIPSSARISFKFTGKSGEYFRIWIVNIFLSILTLGIYSAWAKVSKKRYFYGNTFLQDAPFDYLAEPTKILKGRLIAFGVLIVLVGTAYFLLPLALILAIPAIALFPWLVVRALTFRAKNSSYRNIRFDFGGTYRQAMRVFVGQQIITLLTLGLRYPYQLYRRNKFVINNSAYGTTPFRFWGEVKGFYRIYFWQALGVSLLIGILTSIARTWGESYLPASAEQIFGQLISLSAGLTFLGFVRAAGTNLVWSNVALGDHRFESTLSSSEMIWIYLSNAIAIIVSLGLLIPWASIRMARYRLAHLCVYSSGDLNNFVASEQGNVGAIGEEISAFFDFDLGL